VLRQPDEAEAPTVRSNSRDAANPAQIQATGLVEQNRGADQVAHTMERPVSSRYSSRFGARRRRRRSSVGTVAPASGRCSSGRAAVAGSCRSYALPDPAPRFTEPRARTCAIPQYTGISVPCQTLHEQGMHQIHRWMRSIRLTPRGAHDRLKALTWNLQDRAGWKEVMPGYE